MAKTIHLIFFTLLISFSCLSQDSIMYKFEGYCGKIKLRDIDAPYGEAAFTNKASLWGGTAIRQFVFDYGQLYKKDKEAIISNDKGEPIVFGSIALILNFFDYNGWQYMEKMEEANSYILIFRKKK